MNRKVTTRVIAMFVAFVLAVSVMPLSVFASIPNWEENNVVYDGQTLGTNGYYNVISKKDYVLVPGAAVESEMVLNNAAGTRRQVLHIIEVDPSNPDVSIVPGYSNLDKIAEDPNNEANWAHQVLTDMAGYYEDTFGYNIVGGMNTDLYYDTYAPRVLVYNGKDLSVKGKTSPTSSILYVFQEEDGTISCDVKAFNRNDFNAYLESGRLLHAVGVSFGMVVKDGELVSKKEERTSDPAARSMVGVKADGTLVIVMNDGRGANNSVGLCNYEEGEIMLALGCQWAANCDGGGSSTFLTKRVGEDTFTMRSIPCDGAPRATSHGIFIASNVGPTGELDVVNVESNYDIFAPKTVYTFGTAAIDTHGYAMDMPADATWALSDASFGTIENGKFVSNGTKGTVDVQVLSGGKVVGSKTITVADPATFSLAATSTVVPYSTAEKVRTIALPIVAKTGEADVFMDTNAVTVALSNEAAGTLDGFNFTATSDTAIAGVNVTVTYGETVLTYAIEFGKGSEVIFDFENGDKAGFMGFEEAKKWSQDNGVNNTLVGAEPLAGQFNAYLNSETFMATADNGGQVRNGNYALAWRLDNSDASFAGWSYNVLFNTNETIVLRDVANGLKATTLGMWLYIPENAFPSDDAAGVGAGKGLAFQSQLYVKNADGSYSCKQDHFMFTSAATGKQTNLNSATNADIPESRWVYATIDISKYDYLCMPVATDEGNSRSPSFLRTYVKPTTADIITFYIDDITLDYSSAVDDRVLPTITNPTYSTSDTAVKLDNGTVVNGDKVAFSATVADNSALDLTSGKIIVDGVEVAATINGSALSTKDDVALGAGEHTVVFEVKDELGNPGRVTRTFTVAGNAAVTLSGHNDSGETPKAQSIYYVDINVADLSKVTKLVTQLKLHNANTWETEGAIVANGFKATFEYNEISELLTVTVVKEGAAASEAGTLVSIPARVWTFDRYNYVTNTPYAPADMGNKPVVNVACEVVYGTVDGAPFGGSVFATTELAGISSLYHIHDAELTVLNKEATTEEEGYENRTYCETCKSVVDWGTKLEKKGHNYAIVGNQFVCQDEGCGHVYESGTGIFVMNEKLYYSVNNVLQTGWQSFGTEGYCYADPKTMEVYADCEFVVNGLTYTANADGLMLEGAWHEDYLGRRFSYGPGYYSRCFQTIGGEEYYFAEKTGYALTGYHAITDNRNDPRAKVRWYHFDEDGKLLERIKLTGVLDTGDGLYYMEEGCRAFAGMVKVGDDYYCVADKTGIVLTGYQYVGSYIMANSYNPMATGYYEFGADGKLLQGVVVKEDGTYYYEMGKPVAAGWVKDGNDYYVFGEGGKAYTGSNWVGSYLTQTSKDPYKAGTFTFADDGKLANGVVEIDGVWHYCENGVGKDAGLVYVDGQYYYAEANGKLVSGRIWVGTYPSHGLLPKGYYEFGADGAMLNGVVEKDDGTYYYEVGKPVDTGWLKNGDDYYVFTNGGKALTGRNWIGSYLTQKSRDPYMVGSFIFGADGKMANGVVELDDGWYYYENGVAQADGLICLDGTYYLAEAGGKLATGRVWVGTYASNGLLAKGYYEFGANGAMLQGVVEKEDGLYYYDLGNTQYLGLIERNGEFYYVNEGGKLEIGRVYVGTYASNGLVSKGTYEFGADGAMLNGFEQLADGLYYYNMGAAQYIGLKVIDGDLYYIEEGGKVVTGRVWVGTYAANGLVPAGNYTFAEDGKFVG